MVAEEPVDEESPAIIQNIKAEKIEGPKILGKIDLPVDNDTRPKKDEKRKRKRIPIEKKQVSEQTTRMQDHGQGQGSPAGWRRTDRGGGTISTVLSSGGNSTVVVAVSTVQVADRGTRTREDKLIDEKEIQKKIQETQAKLSRRWRYVVRT